MTSMGSISSHTEPARYVTFEVTVDRDGAANCCGCSRYDERDRPCCALDADEPEKYDFDYEDYIDVNQVERIGSITQ
jgi:hypothetical protein